jgi:predicted metalloprotease with PDZ domain
MSKYLYFVLFILGYSVLNSQDRIVVYKLNHTVLSDEVEIEISFHPQNTIDTRLVIPRSAPGTYELTNYQAFVDDVVGYSVSGKRIPGLVGDGSYFVFNNNAEKIEKVSYNVDIKRMESELLGAYASSKSRKDYMGILGYSVFGFIEGQENEKITLEINSKPDWPIFSTLRPTIERTKTEDSYNVPNYSSLADAQYLLGNAVKVFQVKEAGIPFFVAVYSETAFDIEEIGRRGLMALNGLAEYFGYIPMPHYTMSVEYLHPVSDRHDYGFNMEHLNSMSSSMDISRAITGFDPQANIGSIVHHIGHSWLPLRSYGTGYRPFEWQTAPLIETIWLNEGFTWYISYYNILGQEAILHRFNSIVNTSPEYIASKSLKELSLLGSTQYGMDFRIGKNLFSRGALMAHDLDVYIQEKTKGKKSFKDAIRGLLEWSEKNQRAYEYDEILKIMNEATGVNLSIIWDKWQGRLKHD